MPHYGAGGIDLGFVTSLRGKRFFDIDTSTLPYAISGGRRSCSGENRESDGHIAKTLIPNPALENQFRTIRGTSRRARQMQAAENPAYLMNSKGRARAAR